MELHPAPVLCPPAHSHFRHISTRCVAQANTDVAPRLSLKPVFLKVTNVWLGPKSWLSLLVVRCEMVIDNTLAAKQEVFLLFEQKSAKFQNGNLCPPARS